MTGAAGNAKDIARDHRHALKNQLALVAALAKLLARYASDAGDLASRLEAKLVALARAHDLPSRRGALVNASDAVRTLLDALGPDEQIAIGTIPSALLPDQSLPQLVLVLDALHANAIEHGALRQDQGKVVLSGRFAEPLLTLLWEEECGTVIEPPRQEGSGLTLVRRLGGSGRARTLIDWRPNGVLVEFHLRARGGAET